LDHPDYRDVFCKNCDAKLGWMYEFATEDNQRYDIWVFFSGIVRIVNSTDSELGWMYEFATEDNQRYDIWVFF
jgi:hypothetical protein